MLSFSNQGPVMQKAINALLRVKQQSRFQFFHSNHHHSHNLKMNVWKSLIYNPKAKILEKSLALNGK